MQEDEILEFNYKNPNIVGKWITNDKNPTIKATWENTYRNTSRGFPSDDGLALQQMADGEFDWLDNCYGSTFHQNEELPAVAAGVAFGRKHIFKHIENLPIMKGTLVGTIQYKNMAVQTFVFNSAGVCNLVKIGNPGYFVVSMELSHLTGLVVANWNLSVNMQDIKLVVSYECER